MQPAFSDFLVLIVFWIEFRSELKIDLQSQGLDAVDIIRVFIDCFEESFEKAKLDKITWLGVYRHLCKFSIKIFECCL